MTGDKNRPAFVPIPIGAGSLVLILSMFAIGCTPIEQRSHLPKFDPLKLSIERRHNANVSLELRGMRGPGLFVLGVNENKLRKTVTNLIEVSGVFRGVVARNKANFHLSITVFRVQGTDFGSQKIPGNVELGWTLRDANTGRVVWQEAIETEYLHIGVETKISFAGAIVETTSQAFAENLKRGIEKLSQLSLPSSIDL